MMFVRRVSAGAATPVGAVRVRSEGACSTIDVDLVRGAERATSLHLGHDAVTVHLDAARRPVGLGLALGAGRTLPPAARTALLRYCPDVVGDAVRPDWDAVTHRLLALARSSSRPRQRQARQDGRRGAARLITRDRKAPADGGRGDDVPVATCHSGASAATTGPVVAPSTNRHVNV